MLNEMANLSETEATFLRQLFFDGYEGGRYRRIRWARDDLNKVYRSIFSSSSGFSEAMDNLVANKFIAMELSPSRLLAHFYLPKMSIEYLAANEPNVTIDSTNWTGLPSGFTFNPAKHDRLVSLLKEAEDSLDKLEATNEEKAMARSYLVAAKVLSDAPDPPIDLIWELIGRANQIAGITALLISLIALFSAGK
jgi:hypothetical protein